VESKMTPWERKTVGGQLEEARNKGVKVVEIPSLLRRINPVQDTKALNFLRRLIARENPDIVHTHTYKAGILGCWAARLAGVPHIVHTPHGHVFYGHFDPLITQVFKTIEKCTVPIMDRVVALTEGEREDYINFGVCPPEKLVTIHSGVDLGKFGNGQRKIEEKRKALGLAPDAVVVGTVGWLLPIKGSMQLLKAMGNIWNGRRDLNLVYVGKGDLEDTLKTKAAMMGVENRVRFLGWRDDVHEIMPLFDVFVLPSMMEGMGRALVEAMAAGKPVIGTRVGGIPDLVKDGYNGFLVEPGEVSGLAQAIHKLVGDEDLRKTMGERGMAMAPAYSVEKMIEKIDKLYKSLLKSIGDVVS
jgi:glycosyltransferase involved in cell wall biosynthesis